MPSTVNLPTAHGTVIHSDSETSDEPQPTYHGDNEHEDKAPQVNTAQRPGDWGYGLSASRARPTTVPQQPGPPEGSTSQHKETLHRGDHQQDTSLLGPTTTGSTNNPVQTGTGPPQTATSPAGNPAQNSRPNNAKYAAPGKKGVKNGRTTTVSQQTYNAQANHATTGTRGREPCLPQPTSGETRIATTITGITAAHPHGRG
jgi:hypothetical protein